MSDDSEPCIDLTWEGDEPEEIKVSLPDGTVLRVAMMLDTDGNPTEVLFDACALLAHQEGAGWFEIDLEEGSWELYTIH